MKYQFENRILVYGHIQRCNCHGCQSWDPEILTNEKLFQVAMVDYFAKSAYLLTLEKLTTGDNAFSRDICLSGEEEITLFTTDEQLYQCALNLSEGQREDVLRQLKNAADSLPTVRVIDFSADPDHNRCVLTLLGDAEGIEVAVLTAAKVAVQHIDLTQHIGVHPRTGAVDVVPIVPIQNASREEAIKLADRIGIRLARELGIPVVYYEWSARPGTPSQLPEVRKMIRQEPIAQHPTAGVAIVGARGALVAYNILLCTSDALVAKQIARRIRAERESEPALHGVRAIGLLMETSGKAQLSMNLTQPGISTLPKVYEYVSKVAYELNTELFASEIIGVIPRIALEGVTPESILWYDSTPSQIIENWISLPGEPS